MTGGGVASCWGMNSTGVKFSVLKGRFVGLTRTTRTPVGPNLVSESVSGVCTPLSLLLPGSLGGLVTKGCLARGLVTSKFGCSWVRVGSLLPIVPTGRIRTLTPLLGSSFALILGFCSWALGGAAGRVRRGTRPGKLAKVLSIAEGEAPADDLNASCWLSIGRRYKSLV